MATESEAVLQMLFQLTEKRTVQQGFKSSGAGIKYTTFFVDETDKMIKLINRLRKFYAEIMAIDIDVNINALFDQETGILILMKAIMSCKELEKVKIACLQMLNNLCRTFKEVLLMNHVKQIRELVLEFAVSCETTSKEKEESLEVLMSNLYIRRHMSDLQVNELLTTLCNFEITFGNPPKRVFQRLYQTMGVVCKLYNNVDRALVTRVVSTLLKFLDRQRAVKDHKYVESRMIEGCFDGMRELMYEYSISEEDNDENNTKLYNALKHFLDKSFMEEREKGVPRAGLRLLAEHGEQLASRVYVDYKFWHETFLSWAAKDHPDLHRIGIEGLSTFYSLIAQTLQLKTGDYDRTVFNYFMTYFKNIVLESTKTHRPHEVGLAIQGLGQFSGPCASYLDPVEVNKMFSVILSKAEDFLKQDKPLNFLPKYVLALGTIVGNIHSIGPQYLATLQCLCVLLFENYPKLPIYAEQGSIEALLKTFESMSKKGTIFDEFLDEVVYQAVIRTCSNYTRMDAEMLKERMSAFAAYKFITHDRYLPMWEGLLQISRVARYSGINQNRLHVIATKVFDSFLLALLKLLDKLDFSTYVRDVEQHTVGDENMEIDTNEDDEGNSINSNKQISLLEVIGMDPQTSLKASKPKDFQVFLNVVDLYQELLPKVERNYFTRWVIQLTKSLMLHSSQYPLVSGFYKLLTLCFNLCNEAELFKDISITEAELTNETKQCYQLVSKFIREVLMELGQYKGDLQISCLALVLSVPYQLVPEMLPLTIPVFQIVFSVGQNYIPLALDGINTLKIWSSKIQPPELLQPLLLNTIPYLNKFLHCADQSDGSDSPEELIKLRSKKQTRMRIIRHTVQAEAGEKDTVLSQLQQEILLFLARLDMPTCLALANVDEVTRAKQAVAWTSGKLLRFYLPFSDMKVSIYIETFLPRVAELTLNASDRQIRVTACEFLHAAIHVLLGIGVQVAHEGQERKQLAKLFSKLMPVLLALGCDGDLLVQQLFQPLMLQLTHYLSSKIKLGSEESAILMQTLMDGITHENDTAIRDFAAVCLKEFVIWSIKQSSRTDLEKSPLNIKFILSRIYYFCLHPNPFKRLGGALAVNSLYTVLREEQILVDKFFLEVLYYLMASLQLVGPGEVVLGIKHQTKLAISHVERVLRERCTIFNQHSSERKKPPDFPGVLLKDVIAWLLSLCSSSNTDCRHTSMELVLSLAKWIEGVTSTAEAVLNYQTDHGSDSLVKLCETCGSHQGNRSTRVLNRNSTDPHSQQAWLSQLLGSLECYVWLLEHNLATPNQIFGACGSTVPQIFIVSIDFVKSEVKQNNEVIDSSLSLSEIEQLQEVKCKIVINYIDFLYQIMDNNDSLILSKRVFIDLLTPLRCAEMWQMICNLILKPTSMGFSLKTHNLTKEMEGKLARFLYILPQKLPSMVTELISTLGSFLSHSHTDLGSLFNLKEIVKKGATYEQINYIKGLCTLHDTGLAKNLTKVLVQLHEINGEAVIKKVHGSLAEKRNDVYFTVPICSTSEEYLKELMTLAFYIGVKKEFLFNLMNDSRALEDEVSQTFVAHGEIFYRHLKTPIIDFLLKTPPESVHNLMSAETVNLSHLKFCHILLDLVSGTRHLNQRYSSELSTVIMEKWDILMQSEYNYLMEVIDILTYTAKMASRNSKSLYRITEWVCTKLSAQDIQISFKRRCLDIIPPLLTNQTEDINALLLRKAFHKLDQINFPVKSSEYPVESTQVTEYKSFFMGLLSILKITKSSMMLDFISSIAIRDRDHVCLEDIQTTFKSLMTSLDSSKQLEAMCQIYVYFTDEEKALAEMKMNAVLQLLIPMLLAASHETVEQFFIRHIQRLGSILSVDPVLDDQLSNHRAEKQLVPHICAFSLIETLYSITNKENLSATSVLGKAFSPNGNTVMSKFFLTTAVKVRSDTSQINPNWKDLYIKYQCCALKAAISIICCLFPDVSENESKYNMFIFNVSNTSNFWSKIVDCSKDFNLQMDFDEFPARKNRLISIRKSARVVKNASESVDMSFVLSTIQYPASQKLFDSSLCEDISRFDLSHVDVHIREETSPSVSRAPESPTQESVLLELDEINKHDCMDLMCGLVRHCFEGRKTDSTEDMPEWMKHIRKALISASQHKNVKLFILKLIWNEQNVFKTYAKHWLDPICLSIIDGSLGNTMNYVLSDIVAMLLSWHEIATPSTFSEKSLASNLLELLINLAYHRRRDITKHNLELIKTLIEVWKPILNVKHQIFCDIIQQSSAEPKVVIILQVTAILLVNKILPWNDIGSQIFIDNLVDKHFMDTMRRTNRLAAEIIGMLLKWSTETNAVPLLFDIEYFKKKVENNLKTMYKDKNMFFPSVHIIHKYYSPIVDIFLHNLLYDFLHQIGDFKIWSLELISSRIDTMEDNVREVSNLGLDRLMTAQGTEEQEHALRIVAKLIPSMTASQALPYVSCIPQVLAEAGPNSRVLAYDVLMQVLRHSNANSLQQEMLLNLSIGGLMTGLYDQDISLQQKVLNFWISSDFELPHVTADRFLTLTKKLFVKDYAHLFLSNLIQLMLEATVSSPDYNKPLFDRALSECRFEKYALSDSWRTRHATMMAPLFAETLTNQIASQSLAPASSMAPGQLRATQFTLAFQPTAEMQDDFEDVSEFHVSHQSALLVSLSQSWSGGGSSNKERRTTIDQSKTGNSSQQSSQWKYRFLSNQKQIRSSFARREVELRAKRQQVVKEHKAKQEGQVKIYRSYRHGDFPDIQITAGAIIKPLQVLAKYDQIIARKLFVSLFIAIVNEISSQKYDAFNVAVKEEFQKIYQESGCDVPILSGALMEIALEQDSIELKPDIISAVCASNSLASVGCLIIEKYLNSEIVNPEIVNPSTSKRIRLASDYGNLTRKHEWLKLAELYQALGERDVVLAVLQQALEAEDETLKTAVQFEAALKWQKAERMYKTCTKQADLKDFTTEAYCKCLERLSKWEDMNKWVRNEIPDESLQQFWDIPWNSLFRNCKILYQCLIRNQEKLLPWLVKSEVHGIVERNDINNFIAMFLAWSKDKDKLPHLKRYFSEELSVINLLDGEVERARLFSRHVLHNFLKEWSALSSLLPQLRIQKLSQLHSIIEIIMFADVLHAQDEIQIKSKMQHLDEQWNISKPKPMDSLLIWETRTVYRSYFAKQLLNKKLEDMELRLDPNLETSLKRTTFSQELALIDLALLQKNFAVALKFIQKTRKVVVEKELELQYKIAVSRAKWLFTEMVDTPAEKLEGTMVALEDLRIAVEAAGTNLLQGQQARAKCELAELAWAASRLLNHNKSLLTHTVAQKSWMNRYTSNVDELNCNDVITSLDEYGQLVAMQAVETAKVENSSSYSVADAMLHIVKHCRDIIQQDSISQTGDYKNKVSLLVTYLLGAMKRGSKQARMLFPCILQLDILTQDTTLGSIFCNAIVDIPEWMFLAWTNQLFAYIDTNMINLIGDLLLRVAMKYPKALQIPFQFTLERITANNNSPLPAKLNQLLLRLKEILEPDLLTKQMLQAFSCVMHPEIILQSHLIVMKKHLRNSETLTNLYKKMSEEIFPDLKQTNGIDTTTAIHGQVFRDVSKYKSNIQKIFHPLMTTGVSNNVLNTAIQSLQELLNQLDSNIKRMKSNNFRTRLQLDAYSPFLQHYRGDLHLDFELPGQYTGEKIPLPHHHITISRFEPEVQIMKSIRSPVKVTIIGHNGVSYNFLFKAGEDLRQDERVQQLLKLMNDVLAHDVQCSALKIKIQTYQVLPITCTLGIIEFVKDCISYDEFIKSSATTRELEKIIETSNGFISLLKRTSGGKDYVLSYNELYRKMDRNNTVKYFNEFSAQVPQDLLCRSFKNLSSSPEGLYWLRQSFTASLGVLSIAHWLLGIGDRHLSNMMISMQTGAAIGIDFGHAFGSATQLLPVIELVPFRLTNTMLKLLGPVGHAGILRSSMIKSLHAFKTDHDLLLNTMEVFVKEPSLDWQMNAIKLANNFGVNEDESNKVVIMDYARQKIKLLHHKVEGALPAVVMEEELVTGSKKSSPLLPQFLSVLQGDTIYNERSKLRKQAELQLRQAGKSTTREELLKLNFTTEQQVDCLIDQATDPHILGKMWFGWNPWL